jgi:uncharacterized damage-inducible protein DinB
MNPYTSDLLIFFRRDLTSLATEIELFPDDKRIWETVAGITNSTGNLALHITGNINHYIGHVLGGADYKRDRQAEFGPSNKTRSELAAGLHDAVTIIERVFPRLTPQQLSADFPEPVGGVQIPCDRFLMHLVTHLAHHLGQAGYLRRVLTGENRSSNPVSVKPLKRN